MVEFAVDDLVAEDIDAYLTAHENKSLLRFITCGSVDDGKSTLIGRLLYESKMVFADHLDALTSDSARFGTQGDDLDFALLVDGLTAEREQGITIDVAYRFFTTEKRKFIVADTPGHEQYTRNMVTGASTAHLAVVMIDARKGVLTQSRRHSYLVSLLGVRHVVVAVNKLDLVDYSREVFDQIEADYRDFAEKIGLTDITCIPMSALRGDNVLDRSDNTPWYTGPTLMEHLESVDVDDVIEARPFRMPVQWVNRPNLDFRGFSGQVARGTVRPGDTIRVLPAGTTSQVARIVTMDGDLPEAIVGNSIMLTLTSEIDASRGDMIVADDYAPEVSDQFEAHIVWMDEHEMIPGRPYLMKIGTTTVGCAVQDLKHRVDVNTLEHLAARTLALNEIGLTTLTVDRPIPFDAYADSRDMGGFIIIDRLTNSTVGAGMLKFALRRASNVPWQATTIDKTRRAGLKHQKPTLIWLTGVPGAGKSTLANALEKRLADLNYHTYLLDGDNVRHGLSRDLGFTEADRVENLRRVSHVAALMLDAGLIVITSFISPFRNEREAARDTVGEGEFVEVFLDTTLEEAEARDRKGLYAKARAGELQNFTGFDSPYEPPVAAEITVDTSETPAEAAAEQILAYLRLQGRI